MNIITYLCANNFNKRLMKEITNKQNVFIHYVNGYSYASTKGITANNKNAIIHWGAFKDGVFFPNKRFLALSFQERLNFQFPDNWDLYETGIRSQPQLQPVNNQNNKEISFDYNQGKVIFDIYLNNNDFSTLQEDINEIFIRCHNRSGEILTLEAQITEDGNDDNDDSNSYKVEIIELNGAGKPINPYKELLEKGDFKTPKVNPYANCPYLNPDHTKVIAAYPMNCKTPFDVFLYYIYDGIYELYCDSLLDQEGADNQDIKKPNITNIEGFHVSLDDFEHICRNAIEDANGALSMGYIQLPNADLPISVRGSLPDGFNPGFVFAWDGSDGLPDGSTPFFIVSFSRVRGVFSAAPASGESLIRSPKEIAKLDSEYMFFLADSPESSLNSIELLLRAFILKFVLRDSDTGVFVGFSNGDGVMVPDGNYLIYRFVRDWFFSLSDAPISFDVFVSLFSASFSNGRAFWRVGFVSFTAVSKLLASRGLSSGFSPAF